jgi:diguanylate cyclase (GGDEF)-like protein
MSFRTRLTSFFVVIVVVPMIAVGVLVFAVISDSVSGKADARANGLATAAASLYQGESALARNDAATLARSAALLRGSKLQSRLATLAAQAGLARVTVTQNGRTLASVGDSAAIAPGSAVAILGHRLPQLTVTTSELTASEFAHDLASPQAGVVVSQDNHTLSSTLPIAGQALPRRGTVKIAGTNYRTLTDSFSGFGSSPVKVTVLSDLAATATAAGSSRVLAGAFIIAFLILALAFTVLASRALQSQLRGFLAAARRLASGDFSSPIVVEGHDEFASLGEAFNNMSAQLEGRLEELSDERARLREAVHRIGETFASNLDRRVLLELALKTAVDAVQATSGRLTARSSSEEPLVEAARQGDLPKADDAIRGAETKALKLGGSGQAEAAGTSVASVTLGPLEPFGRARGLITVMRSGKPFSADEFDVLRSLAAQTTLALDNVELHFQVQKQAVTDDLTGLANHGRFQELLGAEIVEVHRYHHSVGLIMLDIDDFKAINDTYGHQQGDVMLRHVARVLRESSRDVDSPARYGGEEMALILPHTDLDGAYAIAERIRTGVEALKLRPRAGGGTLRLTASLGVAATTDGDKDELIAEADAALYQAKREGKNRTVKAAVRAANVSEAG